MTRSEAPVLVLYSRRRNYEDYVRSGITHVVLTSTMWDDHGARNKFDVTVIVDGKRHYVGRIRILAKNARSSVEMLEHAASATSDGTLRFPITVAAYYLSLPESLDVYVRLAALIAIEPLLVALSALHDAVVASALGDHRDSLAALSRTPGYSRSLLRGSAERRALEHGPSVLGLSVAIEDVDHFTLYLALPGLASPLLIDIDFRANLLPSRLFVLIGRNGVGKTQALEALVAVLTGRGARARRSTAMRDAHVEPIPSFGQITAVSYSAYDRFPPDELEPSPKQLATQHDDEAEPVAEVRDVTYLHFGFRTAHRTISTAVAEERAARALMKVITDYTDGSFESDRQRLAKLMQSLRSGFHFDEIAVRYKAQEDYVEERIVIRDGEPIGGLPERPAEPSLQFLVGGLPIFLSAGQNQYVLQVIVLSAYLSERSLILIDEPELGLHPNLEVDYIRAIKELLERFNSYALIATHSALIAREVPSSHVRILSRENDLAWTIRPRIETFGADVSRIAGEVFGDLQMDPAFESQLRRLAMEFESFDAFYEIYRDLLSIEALTLVKNVIFADDARR